MAIKGELNRDGDFFIFQFILAITPSINSSRLINLNSEQIKIVTSALFYIKENMAAIIEENCWGSDLEDALFLWQKLNLTHHSSGTPNGAP